MPNFHTEEKPVPIKFGDESLSDVTISAENQDFLVHRMVLASRSDYFQALFYDNFGKAKENRVEIKDIPADMLKKILEIIYNGKMSDCEAFRYQMATNSNGNKKDYYHRYILCSNLNNTFSKTFKKFWNFVNELLAVADRFNVTYLTLKSLQDEVLKGACNMHNCYFCLNLYMFAFEKKLPILGIFQQKFNGNNYRDWTSIIFDEDAPMRQPLRQLEPKELVVLMNKFSV